MDRNISYQRSVRIRRRQLQIFRTISEEVFYEVRSIGADLLQLRFGLPCQGVGFCHRQKQKGRRTNVTRGHA
jgi:hypothetical protein